MFWAKKIKPTPLAVPVPRTFSTSRKKILAKAGGGQYDPPLESNALTLKATSGQMKMK